MVLPVIQKIEAQEAEKCADIPSFRIGDAITVHCKISEGGKERVQLFAGTVIAMDGKGANTTFTVRRISHGVGVEKVFPMHTPHVAKVEVTRSSHVRRAKLYYLRKRTGKQARLKEKIR